MICQSSADGPSRRHGSPSGAPPVARQAADDDPAKVGRRLGPAPAQSGAGWMGFRWRGSWSSAGRCGGRRLLRICDGGFVGCCWLPGRCAATTTSQTEFNA